MIIIPSAWREHEVFLEIETTSLVKLFERLSVQGFWARHDLVGLVIMQLVQKTQILCILVSN